MGKNKRREFLKNACAPVLIGVLGIPLIQACSKDDNSAIADTSSSNVKTSITIDLNESEFSNLIILLKIYCLLESVNQL